MEIDIELGIKKQMNLEMVKKESLIAANSWIMIEHNSMFIFVDAMCILVIRMYR